MPLIIFSVSVSVCLDSQMFRNRDGSTVSLLGFLLSLLNEGKNLLVESTAHSINWPGGKWRKLGPWEAEIEWETRLMTKTKQLSAQNELSVVETWCDVYIGALRWSYQSNSSKVVSGDHPQYHVAKTRNAIQAYKTIWMVKLYDVANTGNTIHVQNTICMANTWISYCQWLYMLNTQSMIKETSHISHDGPSLCDAITEPSDYVT